MMTKDEFLSKFETSTLSDSGNRTKFDSGAVRDMHEGKGRCDLMPLDVIADIFNSSSVIPKKDLDISYSSDDASYIFFNNLWLFKVTGDTCYLHRCLDSLFSTFRESMTVYEPLLELSKHYENGAIKYGEHNWEKGIPLHSFIDSAIRHYMKDKRGDKDEPHDVACIWNIIGAIWTKQHKPELDDFCGKE